jgi:hypothetical protein
VKNRCASDETDSLVSSRAEESSQTRGAGKRSGTDHRATGFHLPGQSRRRIFMRRYFDAILETEMLLRVVVEETDTQLTVVTLYKTSKFAKYEGGA